MGSTTRLPVLSQPVPVEICSDAPGSANKLLADMIVERDVIVEREAIIELGVAVGGDTTSGPATLVSRALV